MDELASLRRSAAFVYVRYLDINRF